jgi:hypothetical protein
MSTDSGRVETPAPGPRFEMTELVDITIRRVAFESPKRQHFRSKLREYRKAIEFRVQTDRPLNLSEDITPVLYVGETMLTEGERVDRATYTFLAFDEDRLEPGAAISLAYPGTPAKARRESKFRYEPPGER